SVSLNLKARRDERARIEGERLARENSRRAAKNLPALKSDEELDKSKDEAADVVLEQATQVMGDMVTGAHPQPPQKTARASWERAGASLRAPHPRAPGAVSGVSAQQDPEQVPGVLGEHVRQRRIGPRPRRRQHVAFGERERVRRRRGVGLAAVARHALQPLGA